MIKKIFSAAMLGICFFAARAELIETRCIVCGDKIRWIDTEEDRDRFYSVGIGAPAEAKNGYICDNPKKRPLCREVVASWQAATTKKAKEIVLDLDAKAQKKEQQKRIVKDAAEKLKRYFSSAAANKIPVEQQVSAFNKLVSQCNAVDFWCAMVQCGSMDVIKYYWPAANNEKMRSNAAKVIERHKNAQTAASQKAARENLNLLLTANVDPRSGEPAKAVMGMVMPKGVTKAAKTTITPFAIGRSKKDNAILFTDGEDFSLSLLNAAALAARHDVLAYFSEQCGGFTADIKASIYKTMVKAFGAKEKTMFHAAIKLKSLKEQLAKCDTDVEKEKINRSIARFNYLLKKNDYKISTQIAEIILTDISASEMRRIIGSVIKNLSDPMAGVDLMDVAFKLSAAQARSDAAGAFDAASKSMDRRLNENQLKEFGVTAEHVIFEKTANALASSEKPIGKKMKWYAGCYAHWKPGIVDNYEPGYVTDASCGVWKWKAGITVDSGYTSFGVLSKNNFDVLHSVKWIPGRIVKSRPGYVTGKKEGTFAWKPGIPDKNRIGFVSGTKEGTWTAAPGFVIKDGKAVWTAGKEHPGYKGVLATEKMFVWMPDEKHLWVNPESGDLAAQEDYKTMPAGVKKAFGKTSSGLR